MKSKQELKSLDSSALRTEVHSLRKELFDLRLSRLTGQAADHTQGRRIKTAIAQCYTFIRQQELAAQQAPVKRS